jgi:hypothetical protein
MKYYYTRLFCTESWIFARFFFVLKIIHCGLYAILFITVKQDAFYVSILIDKLITKAQWQENVRCSFKLKLDLDVIPSLSNKNVLTETA